MLSEEIENIEKVRRFKKLYENKERLRYGAP